MKRKLLGIILIIVMVIISNVKVSMAGNFTTTLTGNGQVGLTDLSRIKSHLIGTTVLTGNGTESLSNLSRFKQYLIGMITIL